MEVYFDKDYLFELYTTGKASDKKHRFQPQIVKKYVQVIKLMTSLDDVNGLMNMAPCIMNILGAIRMDSLR